MLKYIKAFVIIEKSLRESKKGQNEVWTAKKGDEGTETTINLFTYKRRNVSQIRRYWNKF